VKEQDRLITGIREGSAENQLAAIAGGPGVREMFLPMLWAPDQVILGEIVDQKIVH